MMTLLRVGYIFSMSAAAVSPRSLNLLRCACNCCARIYRDGFLPCCGEPARHRVAGLLDNAIEYSPTECKRCLQNVQRKFWTMRKLLPNIAWLYSLFRRADNYVISEKKSVIERMNIVQTFVRAFPVLLFWKMLSFFADFLIYIFTFSFLCNSFARCDM